MDGQAVQYIPWLAMRTIGYQTAQSGSVWQDSPDMGALGILSSVLFELVGLGRLAVYGASGHAWPGIARRLHFS